ncbi:tankyrase-2-like [Hibiscus syriacus]|uniref:Tankyrase-2-like n=2 Tax=Hibiscus syriacus TaxID=106335 RepID=A0A6A2XXN6_HIBSY|nr:tankyrase-2-like [Hibiscus syriacus]
MEEVVLCKDDQLQIIKGKRTKRPRIATSTTCSSGGEIRRSNVFSREFDGASGSTTTSVELETHDNTAEEEEDEENMAYCLMLLSQGQTRKPSEPVSSYVHQCKTCNRCFPSFQALGGHRASHKKPKVHHEEFSKEDDNMNTTLSLRVTNKKSRVHECSICGAEFSSGQALGGHMRRHRTSTNAPTRSSAGTDDMLSNKPRTVLQLDLNLPAPEDDHQFASKEKLLVFSASSLVDCHY